MSKAKKHAHLLKWLTQTKPQTARAVLKVVDKGVIDAISECALNILRGNLTLTQGQKQKLCKHKRVLRLLANKKSSLNTKRRALQQKGGFLGLLLGPVLKTVAHLLFN